MSARYNLIPLSEMWRPLPELCEWLEGMGLVIPDDWQDSRNPTATEVRSVVRELADENQLSVETDFHAAGDDLDAVLITENDSTFLSVADYTKDGDDHAPRRISFQYGDPDLVVPICERLASLCGPFLLTNNGAFFVIVTAGTPPDAEWAADKF